MREITDEAFNDLTYNFTSTAFRLEQQPGNDDWWLLDDARLVVMEFDDAGELTGLHLETDDASLARARTLRELALRAAPSWLPGPDHPQNRHAAPQVPDEFAPHAESVTAQPTQGTDIR